MLEKLSPIMPARDISKTEEFYAELGFETVYCGSNYLLMKRDGAEAHFFRYADLDPSANYCGAYLRPSDIDALSREIAALGLPAKGIPRFEPAADKPWGMRELALIDLNGNLIRAGQEI
jgi:catechol 2,3-dioxygenase-like lactoylglutathione lyase family enzyme